MEYHLFPLATLVPTKGNSVYGIVAELSQAEVEILYSRENMRNYKPAGVTIETKAGKRVQAQCFISKPVSGQYPSHDYLQRVIHASENLGFPKTYLAKLGQTRTVPSP